MTQAFVILYKPGPAWIAGKPVAEQPLQKHVEYMYDLSHTGKLLMGGPFADNTGGLVILDGVEENEAWSVLAHDPAVIAHVLTGTLHLWHPMTRDRDSRAE